MLVSNFTVFKEVLETIAFIASASILIVNTYTYALSNKQFNFTIITNYINHFQSIISQL